MSRPLGRRAFFGQTALMAAGVGLAAVGIVGASIKPDPLALQKPSPPPAPPRIITVDAPIPGEWLTPPQPAGTFVSPMDVQVFIDGRQAMASYVDLDQGMVRDLLINPTAPFRSMTIDAAEVAVFGTVEVRLAPGAAVYRPSNEWQGTR